MLRAAGDEDLLRIVLEVAIALQLCDDGLLELGDAVDDGVLGEALVDGLLGRVFDVGRGVEIRLAGAEADDVAALGPQLRGAGRDDQRG